MHIASAMLSIEPTSARDEPSEVCAPRWGRVTVQGDIDRCIAGDGDGCASIGDEYKNGCDAFSSIKWYRRGCRLGSSEACATLAGLGEGARVIARD